MYQEERQNWILNYVNQHKKASIQELSQLTETSVVTIRADLYALQKKGLLVKTHGGVLANSYHMNDVIPSDVKFQKQINEKRKVAKMALKYIQDGDVLILDSGSTILELARQIEASHLTVVTNDLQIALELAKKPGIDVTVSGGTLIPGVYTLAGYETVEFYRKIRVEKLFMSCDAIDAEFGISNRDKREIAIKQAMIQAAKEVTVLADHSKLHDTVFMQVTGFDKVHRLIIDDIDEQDKKHLQEIGVEVIAG